MNKVAILFLAWNRLKFTQMALAKHLVCAEYPHTLFISDNGSTDGTTEWLKKIEQDPKLREEHKSIQFRFLYYKKNFGKSRVQNHFMRTVYPDVDYMGFVQNDCWVDQNWLQKFVEVLDKVPEIGIVGPSDREWAKHDYRDINGVQIYVGDQLYWNDEYHLMRKSVMDAMEKLDRYVGTKAVHSGYYLGNCYGMTESYYYGAIKGSGFKMAVVPSIRKIKLDEIHTELSSSPEYKKHVIKVKRVYCMHPEKYAKDTSGVLTWEENGKEFTFENEPSEEREYSFNLDPKQILPSALDRGVVEADIQLLSKADWE
jgi:glycosyltransferase involved in cell wall biosynthesis